eukprot:TRINITY_DN34272_c0_g1_i1.p1 TRINITY_DN34272_c0_g1~~TRINITY_DN34272_c0_g1_i1.p1  ORF type:complete len:459 (-),score=61.27 TRINITY_DN34272_c0_g1_i1:428-1804(-)
MPHITKFRHWSVGDVVAGVTVGATSLPQYIAYAELAGLAGHKGLQSSGPPILGFALLTGSPSLCIGVTSISALMSYATLGGAEYREEFGDEKWMDLLGAWSVLVGVLSILMAMMGAVKLCRYIPSSVKSGWKLGFATAVIVAQTSSAVFNAGATTLKKLCKLPLLSDGTPITGGTAGMYRLSWMLTHPQFWDLGAVALTLLTFFIVFLCKSMLMRIFRLPGIEVIGATAIGTLLALSLDYSGAVVGVPPTSSKTVQGDAAFDLLSLASSWVRLWPWEMPWAELVERLGGLPFALGTALAFSCVDFLGIISVVPDSPANELAGQGVGCVLSGMCGSAPIGGSLSRSMVAGMTGATSPLMGFVSGVTTLLLAFPQIGTLLAPVPKAILAAIVLAAVLPGVLRPKDVLKLRGIDAVAGWSTAIASCFLDPTKGFGVGLVVYTCLSLTRRLLVGKDKSEKSD